LSAVCFRLAEERGIMLNRNYTRKIVPSYFFQRIDFVRFFATSLNLFHTLELFGKLRASDSSGRSSEQRTERSLNLFRNSF